MHVSLLNPRKVPKKGSVGRSQVEYLGHVIGSGTIQPKDDKLQAVNNFPDP